MSTHVMISTASRHINVTIYPVPVNCPKNDPKLVPVVEKKSFITDSCSSNATPIISSIMMVSTARSVTTVPNALVKFTLS